MDVRRLALLLAAAVVATACQASVTIRTERAVAAWPEPPPVAQFVAAYGAGDEVAAERAASPLYAAEWARRRLSARDRAALRVQSSGDDGRPAPLTFQYVDAAVEPDGTTHLFYLVRPTGRSVSPTVWRVDADAWGRVIWAEMVWLFSNAATEVGTVTEPDALRSLPLSRAVADLRPRLALGLRAAGAREGYYALEVDAPGAGSPRRTLLFMVVDEFGQARPGAWSYRQPEPGAAGARRAG